MSERRPDSELDGELERRAKRAFDLSVQELDGATRSRLTQARHRALKELDAGARSRSAWPLVPAGVLAAGALAAVLLVTHDPSRPEVGLQQVAAVADLEILLGEEDLEMLDEEIDFYAWLAEQPDFTPPAATDDGVG